MMTATATHAPTSIGSVDAGSARLADGAAIVGMRIGLWVGVQVLVAGLIVIGAGPESDEPINAAAGWWMVYGSIVDIATLGLIIGFLRRSGRSYRSLLGPPAAAWQIGLGVAVVLAASLPAVVFSSELTSAMYGAGATPPLLALVDVPLPAALWSATLWPVLAELAEPVAFFGIVLPALERRTDSAWIAAPLMVAIWALEHAFFPVLLDGAAIDATFAAYRVLSVLPFLAMWTALYYAFGRRLLPLMLGRWIFNGGTAVAIAAGLV
jgi:hypothetical protein